MIQSEPLTWEEAAEHEGRLVLAEYRDRLQRASSAPFDEVLDRRFDELRAAVDQNDSTWARIEYRHLASVALVGYVAASGARVKDAMDKVLSTIAAKQHDYGYDNIAGFGSQGLVVRISDKRARLRNLKKRGAPANEPLLDTWLDIGGYCIVGLMWEAGTFKLPLAADQLVTTHEDVVPRLGDLTTSETDWHERVREIAREEIEKWAQKRLAENAKAISEATKADKWADRTVPDLKGLDHPTVRNP